MCIVAYNRAKTPYHIRYKCSLLKIAQLSCRVYNEYFEYSLFLSKLSSVANSGYNSGMLYNSCYELKRAYSSNSFKH